VACLDTDLYNPVFNLLIVSMGVECHTCQYRCFSRTIYKLLSDNGHFKQYFSGFVR